MSLRRLGLVAGLLSILASCSGAPLPNSAPQRVQQMSQASQTRSPQSTAVRPLPARNEALFPIQQGYRWDYAVTVAPVMDPYAEEHGTYSLQIDKATPTPAGTAIELRGLSGFSQNYSFPTLIQGPNGVQLQDFNFLGFGSDEIKGLKIDFMHAPLQAGMRWEEENWLAKVKGVETVSVPAGNFQAWRVEVIGTYDSAYTAVGDYWIAPGAGIVKAVYTVPEIHVEMLLSKAGVGPALRK